MSTAVDPRSAEALREHDEVSEPAPSGGMKAAGGLAGWLDDRTGGAGFMSYLLKKTFPDHWTFMLGEIAMYTLIICLLTGTFLTFWFVPSAGQVVYDGSYLPLQGITMSEAYQSTVRISFDVRGGLLIRQIHHWAALLFIVAITVHMCRVFFTGAFRKPREINWVIGTLLSMLALLEGFAGYSLPDDLLSGTGLRAAEGFIRSIPIIGSYMTVIVFGGPFPGEQIIPLLFSVHILLLPAIIVGLFTAHIVLVFVHKHTQYPGPGRTNMNVVGYPFMPVYIAKAGGFFFLVFGICALISGAGDDQPDLGVRALRPVTHHRGLPTGLVHGLRRRRPTAPARLARVRHVRPHVELQRLPGRHRADPRAVHPDRHLPVPREVGHRRQPGAPPARPAAQRPGPHRHRRHGAVDLPDPLPRRRQRHHRHQAAPVDQRHHADPPGGLLRRPAAGVLGHQADLPQPAARTTATRCCTAARAARSSAPRRAASSRSTSHSTSTSAGPWSSRRSPEPLVLGSQADTNGVAAKHARKERIRARLSHFYFKDRVAPVTPAELAAAHHHGEHETLASPETSGSLEGPPETQGLGLPMSERESVKRAPEKDL